MVFIKKLFNEPVIMFLLIGGLFYLMHGWVFQSKRSEEKRIVVSPDQIEQLTVQFSRTWMRPPTETERQNLIKNYVRDEVYFREAINMGLDKNDQVIRRRMRQKLEMLMDNIAEASVPSDQMLMSYMQENEDKFRLDDKITFMQVYLNPDDHPDLERGAQATLARLKAGESPEDLGDPILVGYKFEQFTESAVRREFGIDFTEQIIKLTPGDWTGPIYSGLGAHLVKITERVEGKMPELAEVRRIVEREWMAERTRQLKDAAYGKLLAGYEVIFEEKGSGE
jgi:hypothetical protein